MATAMTRPRGAGLWGLDLVTLGGILRSAREAKDMEVRELAEKTRYDRLTILRIEAGTANRVPLNTVWNIARALDLDLSRLCKQVEVQTKMPEAVAVQRPKRAHARN